MLVFAKRLLLKRKDKLFLIASVVICLAFFTAYSVLSIVRHTNFQSFGYDLGINDQVVWRYSNFQLPFNTIQPFPDKTKLVFHVELIYAFIAPFYWIWGSKKMLLLVEVAALCLSGIAVYLLSKKKGLKEPIALSLIIGYLGFYGVQNGLWFDVHSTSFGAAFVMWFIYFLETKKKIPALIFFFLAITAKENFAIYTLLISFVYYFKERTRLPLFFMFFSVSYLVFIFFVYFPYIVQMNYFYANKEGLFSNLNPMSLIDTAEKREVIWYSFLTFGFIPLLSPLYLIPILGNLALFFVIASDLTGAHGLSEHYRTSLAPLLLWATIMTIAKYKVLNKWYIGLYILICVMVVQYVLHLPLSYLSKTWFWREPSSVKDINAVRAKYLPKDASVVAQNNIVPHISHRDKIYSLYPERRHFEKNSPCGQTDCAWFRWYDHPEFLFVDTSKDWDSRHLLANREEFIEGLHNLEKAKIITKYKQQNKTILYKVNKNPESYK